MYNYECLQSLLKDNDLNISQLINYYISYISIFYGIKIYDEIIKEKVEDLEEYIKGKIGEQNV